MSSWAARKEHVRALRALADELGQVGDEMLSKAEEECKRPDGGAQYGLSIVSLVLNGMAVACTNAAGKLEAIDGPALPLEDTGTITYDPKGKR